MVVSTLNTIKPHCRCPLLQEIQKQHMSHKTLSVFPTCGQNPGASSNDGLGFLGNTSPPGHSSLSLPLCSCPSLQSKQRMLGPVLQEIVYLHSHHTSCANGSLSTFSFSHLHFPHLVSQQPSLRRQSPTLGLLPELAHSGVNKLYYSCLCIHKERVWVVLLCTTVQHVFMACARPFLSRRITIPKMQHKLHMLKKINCICKQLLHCMGQEIKTKK